MDNSDDSFPREEALKEYEFLRLEILESDKSCLRAVAISFSATAILMAQAFDVLQNRQEDPNASILLLPPFLLLIVFFYVAAKRANIALIAGYISTILETRLPGLNWETAYSILRDERKKKHVRLNPGGLLIKIERVFFFGTAALCLVFFEYEIYSRGAWWQHVTVALLFVCWFGGLWYAIRGLECELVPGVTGASGRTLRQPATCSAWEIVERRMMAEHNLSHRLVANTEHARDDASKSDEAPQTREPDNTQ